MRFSGGKGYYREAQDSKEYISIERAEGGVKRSK